VCLERPQKNAAPRAENGLAPHPRTETVVPIIFFYR
jgi:hypothetical protein